MKLKSYALGKIRLVPVYTQSVTSLALHTSLEGLTQQLEFNYLDVEGHTGYI